MKIYSKILIIVSLFLSANVMAQTASQSHNSGRTPNSFFQSNGNVALETTQMSALADTIATIFHRSDDVVWSRIVYRVIDMRDKQNNQLYFPIMPNKTYKSLFRVMLEACVLDTLKMYPKVDETTVVANFDKPESKDDIKSFFSNYSWDGSSAVPKPIFEDDPVTNQSRIIDEQTDAYPEYAKNIKKFLIEEIVFFDKHYSRMYSKIIAIAPINTKNSSNVVADANSSFTKQGLDFWNYFKPSIGGWFLFDQLRPYLAKQYVIPNGNESKRMTYDDFFAQKLYSSYLLGDSNMFNRMLLQSYSTPDQIRKEQNRIDTEILNVEQDLWEY